MHGVTHPEEGQRKGEWGTDLAKTKKKEHEDVNGEEGGKKEGGLLCPRTSRRAVDERKCEQMWKYTRKKSRVRCTSTCCKRTDSSLSCFVCLTS